MPLRWIGEKVSKGAGSQVGMMTVLVALVAAGCWIAAAQAGKSAARGSSAAVEKKARELAAKNEHDSIKRSVDTCNRGNPGRAYLLLRAGEFTKTSTLKQSFTTGISPSVWGILYCEETVRQGTNVALSLSVQREYLRVFRRRLVPVVRNGRIISYIPFSIYFRRIGVVPPRG